MKDQLFGDANALGASVRVGSERYRVVGVMRAKGTMIGFDLDDTVYVPAARALELFDRDSLFEIDVLYDENAPVEEVVAGIRRVMIARHGDEDFTITTQQQMLDTLGSVLGVLTFAVAALGSISLLVGAVGIFTIMTIAVRERTAEVGLLRALGARTPAGARAVPGRGRRAVAVRWACGPALGAGAAWLLGEAVSQLPVSFSTLFMGLALALSVVIGLVAGILPALNAASSTRSRRCAPNSRSGAGRTHPPRRDRFVWIVGPVVLRVAALQLLAHFVIAASPEALEVARHLHGATRGRQQLHGHGTRASATRGEAVSRRLPAAAPTGSARRSSIRWQCASRSAR